MPRGAGVLWLKQFGVLNWLGLLMFVVPVFILYVTAHLWLMTNDPLLFYVSLYCQLGLLLMAWRQIT